MAVKMRLSVFALLGLALAAHARAEASLQQQVDELRKQVDYLRQNYEPSEPEEFIKQVTEWVSPSG